MHRSTRLLLALGAAVALLGIAGGAAAMTDSAPGVVGVYPSTDSPYDLAVNSEGDLWVAYSNASPPRIARLNVHGVQQVSVPLTTPDALPLGIATDPAGDAYVADSNNNAILVYSKSGALLHTYTDPAHMNGPVGIDVSSNGTIYVADAGNDQVEFFSASGGFAGQFGAGTLSVPNDLAVDPSGNVWVADSGNEQIVEYSSSGTQIRAFGSEGSGNGEFEIPEYISVSPGGQIFVADENNSRVQEFSSSGQFVNTWGSGGDTSGLFTNPLGLDADVAGNVYVADEGNARIERFYLGANPCTKVDRHHIGPCTSQKRVCMNGLVPAAEVKCIAQVTAKFKRYRTK
jgi:tripartite motif-containing protein 71